jgi:hypothetical protein
MSNIVFDAAYPPATPPPSAKGVMGYIGGHRATHVWTPQQWQPFAHLRQFPIWVLDFSADPAAQGRQAVAAAVKLGWAAHWPFLDMRAIVVDLETGVDPAKYAAIAAEISVGGFIPVAYGSLSTVTGNNASNLIVANWDDVPRIPAGQDMNGIQYQAEVPFGGTQVDYSLFDDWLMNRGGLGARHGA